MTPRFKGKPNFDFSLPSPLCGYKIQPNELMRVADGRCGTMWDWHVHLLCQFRFEVSKNSFAGTGVLSQMLFAWSKSRKLVYLHDAFWKDRSYFQLTAHRLNE
jgi:hypothetical protein